MKKILGTVLKALGLILALLFAGILLLCLASPIKNNMEAQKVANAINPAADFVVVELDENNAEDNNQEQPNVEIDNNGAQ